MATAVLRKEEGFGLVLAIAAHAGLVAWLVLRPPMPEPLPVPETMTVTLSDEVGLTSTSPEPAAEPSPDSAPVIGEAPPPPEPVARIEPVLAPKVVPRPVPKATPRPVVPQRATPAPRPTPRATSAPPRNQPPAKAGGSRLGDDFLKGVPNAQATGTSSLVPLGQIGQSARNSINAAIYREIRPHWQGQVPQGPDAELLVSLISIELNSDGSLARDPILLEQKTNALNQVQARRHAEVAIRAIRRAAPFDLPPELYNYWRRPPPLRMRKSP